MEIIARLRTDPLPANTILNVNVPDRRGRRVRNFETSRPGNRHRAEPCTPQQDPRGREWWWIGAAGEEQDAGPGTDFHAVRSGYIAIADPRRPDALPGAGAGGELGRRPGSQALGRDA